MAVFSYYVDKSFYSINENLTVYAPYGESKKYPIFGKYWFRRRSHSFQYLNRITLGKLNLKFNLDFIITNIIYKTFQILLPNKKKIKK